VVEGGAALRVAQFVGLCGEYPDMRMEKTVDGDIVMMPG
jgi:hypothetical protein